VHTHGPFSFSIIEAPGQEGTTPGIVEQSIFKLHLHEINQSHWSPLQRLEKWMRTCNTNVGNEIVDTFTNKEGLSQLHWNQIRLAESQDCHYFCLEDHDVIASHYESLLFL
jgi:hypothetical protein